MNTTNLGANQLRVKNVISGELFITSYEQYDVLRAVLGSCVGISMYHKSTKVGALAHVMLPSQKLASRTNRVKKPKISFRYADQAIDYLITEFEKRRIPLSEIEVKLAGGAAMFGNSKSNLDIFKIGQRNIEMVINKLNSAKLTIKAQDIRKFSPRVMSLFLKDGLIQVR